MNFYRTRGILPSSHTSGNPLFSTVLTAICFNCQQCLGLVLHCSVLLSIHLGASRFWIKQAKVYPSASTEGRGECKREAGNRRWGSEIWRRQVKSLNNRSQWVSDIRTHGPDPSYTWVRYITFEKHNLETEVSWLCRTGRVITADKSSKVFYLWIDPGLSHLLHRSETKTKCHTRYTMHRSKDIDQKIWMWLKSSKV